jgi:Tfp pilus assembly protein PilE
MSSPNCKMGTIPGLGQDPDTGTEGLTSIREIGYNTVNSKRHRKIAHMTKITKSTVFRREGFSLFELVIVIVVIVILLLLLFPPTSTPHTGSDYSRSRAFLQQVASAAEMFKSENNGMYPGQSDLGLLKGTSPQSGPYTGSQILAASLFGYPYSEINSPPANGPNATSKYLQYKSYLLINESSTGESIPNNSLGDDSKTINALLYFPSRLNVTTPNECYKWDDNSDYISKKVAKARMEFNKNCIRNPKLNTPDKARIIGGILMIGTGGNDMYLEPNDNDDITNWPMD